MKFEKFLNAEAVPEWRPKYLNYHLLKEHLRNIPLNQGAPEIETEFLKDIRMEVRKFSQFYLDKQRQLQVKYAIYRNELSKRDLINLYTETDLLKNFQSLNQTALRKIVKKFTKVTGNALDVNAFEEIKMDADGGLDDLMRRIEDDFTIKWAGGDRHRAMNRLRRRNLRNESFHTVAWLAGLFWGSSFLLIVYILSYYPASTPFYILANLSTPFWAVGLFSINAIVFKRSFVNYQFVFQFEKRTALHECQYSAIAGLFTLIFLISSAFVLRFTINDSSTLIPVIITGAVFINPTPWLWSRARFWMMETLFRIITAPLSPVIFKDFFINDHLISQSSFLQGILMAFGVDYDSVSVKLIPAIPNLTRSLQCLRRYKDTRINLNLINALKYIFVILIIVMRTFLKGNVLILGLLNGISTLFSLYWDLVMDFGLLQRNSFKDYRKLLLRNQLVVFPYKFIYYYVIVFNSLARFSWIIADCKVPISKENLKLILALIEIMRRFHWSFLRIEYEHLNNCNSFRAVDDLKISVRTGDLFYKDMVSESQVVEYNEEESESVKEYDDTINIINGKV